MIVELTEHKFGSHSVTAAAPSSTANFGPGFDIFGLAVDAFDDYVTIKRSTDNNPNHGNTSTQKFVGTDDSSSPIRIEMVGQYHESIPVDASRNSAGLVIQKIIKDFDVRDSFSVIVNKNIPPGFGMGSSAASAAASVMAIDTLLDLHLPKSYLVRYAAEGEKASAGSIHYDNVVSIDNGRFCSNPPLLNNPRVHPYHSSREFASRVCNPKFRCPCKKNRTGEEGFT